MSADSYHKYKEDVQLAADMGVGVYRVSVAWSRIVPEGLGAVSPEVGLQKITSWYSKTGGRERVFEICNHSYIYSHFHSCVGKEKMILFTSNNCVPLSTLTVDILK